jgi:hypothetical protein
MSIKAGVSLIVVEGPMKGKVSEWKVRRVKGEGRNSLFTIPSSDFLWPMAPEPKDRFQTALEMKAALRGSRG